MSRCENRGMKTILAAAFLAAFPLSAAGQPLDWNHDVLGQLRAAEAPAGVAGNWTLDVARSTPIRPWDTQSMTIAVTGDSVVMTRHLAWGADRKVSDTTAAVTDGRTATANPVGYWLDTWYTNVYIGGDHQKHVTGEWLDGGRVLKSGIKSEQDAATWREILESDLEIICYIVEVPEVRYVVIAEG